MIRRSVAIGGLLALLLFLAVPSRGLDNCDSRAREWEAWAAVNVPRHLAMVADYDRLRDENMDLRARIDRTRSPYPLALFAVCFGITSGIMAAWGIGRVVRRAWPFSRERRQLTILVIGALWVTVAACLVLNDPFLSGHPINMLTTMILYSVPAVLFGGICLWWISRSVQMGIASPMDHQEGHAIIAKVETRTEAIIPKNRR